MAFHLCWSCDLDI